MMHAHMPPFSPNQHPGARLLYDETSAIAAAQDAKLDPGNDALPSILADFRAVVKRLEAYAERLRVDRKSSPKWSPQWAAEQGIPAESAHLASFGPNADIPSKSPKADTRIATPAEIDGLRDVLSAEELKGFGIGDVPRHVMHAEALRDEYEKGKGETGV
jgi:hypothetical protein